MASAPESSDTPAAPRSRAVTVMVLTVALALGGVTGMLAIGPRLAPSADAASGADHGGKKEEGGHGPASAAGQMFSLDGVIVNPAGSRGRHHLIATISWKATTAEDAARLRVIDVQLRDKVSALLERLSIDQLTAPGIREQLRRQLAEIVTPYLVDGGVEVFLPQLIVQ